MQAVVMVFVLAASAAGFVEQVRSGDAAAVKRALAGGMSPDAVDDDGIPVLHRAAILEKPDVLELLLAKPERKTRMATPPSAGPPDTTAPSRSRC